MSSSQNERTLGGDARKRARMNKEGGGGQNSGILSERTFCMSASTVSKSPDVIALRLEKIKPGLDTIWKNVSKCSTYKNNKYILRQIYTVGITFESTKRIIWGFHFF